MATENHPSEAWLNAQKKASDARQVALKSVGQAFGETYEYPEDYLREALRLALKDAVDKERTSW